MLSKAGVLHARGRVSAAEAFSILLHCLQELGSEANAKQGWASKCERFQGGLGVFCCLDTVLENSVSLLEQRLDQRTSQES